MRARMGQEAARSELIARGTEARRIQGDIEGRMKAEGLQRRNNAARNMAQTMFDDQLAAAEKHRRDKSRDQDQAEQLAKGEILCLSECWPLLSSFCVRCCYEPGCGSACFASTAPCWCTAKSLRPASCVWLSVK